MVTGGGIGGVTGSELFTVLDNLIYERRLPPLVVVSIGPGGQDAQASERDREYDTISGDYAQWGEIEVLPFVESATGIRCTRDPDGGATIGISSCGAAAFAIAYFHPELYRRVLGYSPTPVNQEWPHSPALPGGAWNSTALGPDQPNRTRMSRVSTTPFRRRCRPAHPCSCKAPVKPIRFWLEVGDQDLFYPDVSLADDMHGWVLANENMAAVLASKDYQYQFIFSHNARHVDGPTGSQTLPEALECCGPAIRACRSGDLTPRTKDKRPIEPSNNAASCAPKSRMTRRRSPAI